MAVGRRLGSSGTALGFGALALMVLTGGATACSPSRGPSLGVSTTTAEPVAARPFDPPEPGTGIARVDGQDVTFVVSACSLTTETISVDDMIGDGEIHVLPPPEPVDVLMSLEGSGTMADGQTLLVEMQKLGGGGLTNDLGDDVVLSVGSRLEPVRRWEGFRTYDPDSGEATTNYGAAAPSGPLIHVEGSTVMATSDFVESEGLGSSPDDPRVDVAVAATCSDS